VRPKKRILYVDLDELRASRLRYTLMIQGYNVFSAETAAEASYLLQQASPIDAMLIQGNFNNLAALLFDLHAQAPFVPQTVVAAKEQTGIIADLILRQPTVEEMLERLRFACARKRGPRRKQPMSADVRAALITERSIA
jgi:DNA-binding response OmpR family regulator